MAKINAGYEITDQISLSGKHYVLGQHTNPNAPAPFVTWEANADQTFFLYGHYFTERQDAQLDLLRRSTQDLDLGSQSIGRALLTEQDRSDLYMEFRNENAKADIEAALAEELDCQDEQYDLDALLADPNFMDRAMYFYDNLSHSYENEALRDNIADILEDFPQHKIPELKDLEASLQIPPELNALITDLLSMPTDQVPEKYGPLGDNISFSFPLSNGMTVVLDLVPSHEPAEPFTLSKTEPHHVQLQLWDKNGDSLYSEFIKARDFEGAGLPGDFHISHEDLSITVTLEEDVTLRRVGNSFVFHTQSTDEQYTIHDGDICTIQRALTPKECDILCSGLMWEAKFPDGDVIHVFDDELIGPVPERSQKMSLTNQIQAADARKAENAGKTSTPRQREAPFI